MSEVHAQYEAFPYPDRNPEDERKRLISGSPSDPVELDHFVFAGKRDWTQPFRALVAGGGTGDGLIQLAQKLTWAKVPHEICYLDLSIASRRIAEERAKIRGLTSIRFETGSLLDAAQYGPFDYIDCCGVLHHLPDPEAGFSALRAATAPGGGLGFMVYAPYGRSGVYPLQSAFSRLFGALSPEQKLKKAKALFETLPDDHPIKRNRIVGDHKMSDAGFYDLLLHSQDRAFSVTELLNTVDASGWVFSGFTQSALYDLSRLTKPPADLSPTECMATAEELRGTIKVHVGYAVMPDAAGVADGTDMSVVPHLKAPAADLAKVVAAARSFTLNVERDTVPVSLPKACAPLIAAIDGKRNLKEISRHAKCPPKRFETLWSHVERELGEWGLLLYSGLLRSHERSASSAG